MRRRVDSTISVVDPVTGSQIAAAHNPCTRGFPFLFRPASITFWGPAISDNGVAVFSCPDDFRTLSSSGQEVVISSTGAYPMINRAGTVIVYLQYGTRSYALRSFDLATKTDTVLAQFPGSLPPEVVGADSDLNRILYIGTDAARQRQLYSLTRGSSPVAITNDPYGVQTATLSGDGRICFVETIAGQIFRLHLAGGPPEEWIPRTISSGGVIDTSPGGVVHLIGAGLASGTSDSGFSFRVAGGDAAVLSATVNDVYVQIPWDLEPPRAYPVEVKTYFASLFEPAWMLNVAWAGKVLAVVHSDFSALVDANHRAALGEIVHFYATGLGPVEQSPPLGTSPPATLLKGGLACDQGGNPLQVLYAGLAPGLVGYYQVSVRLPSTPFGLTLVHCAGEYASFNAEVFEAEK